MVFVVVVGVAAGPLDPGSGLTGTLHYMAKSGDVNAKALSTLLGELLHGAMDEANADKIGRAISNDLLNLNPQDDDQVKVIESIINLVAADSATEGVRRLVKIMRDLYSCRRNQGEDLAIFAKRFEALATLYLNNNHGKNEENDRQIFAMLLLENACLPDTLFETIFFQLTQQL